MEIYKLDFDYDSESDVLTIEGVRYSAQLFRDFSPQGFVTGTLFCFTRHGDGTFYIEKQRRKSREGSHQE